MSATSVPSMADFLTKNPYSPPSWASHLRPIPSHTFSLAHLPTPIHRWNLPGLPNGTELWIKRDDFTGMELSGNKVRKLEFLMAEAVDQHADTIITIGGIQSNHCRATTVASNYLNLNAHLILRTSKLLADEDPGLVGNLLVERLVGANVHLISKEEYSSIGSEALTNALKEKLEKEGKKPYVIPVGGSNSLGTWGYIEAAREIEEQLKSRTDGLKFDDIVVACGSGGTIAGISLGSWLGALKAKVHAFSVCDDPDYFYNFVQGLLDGLQAGVNSRDIVKIHNAKGKGYAMNTLEELKFVKEVASSTGVVLDPVYSGKAVYGLVNEMTKDPKSWEGKKILFIHTGGLLGLYEKVDQMASLMGNWCRMDVSESVPRKDAEVKECCSLTKVSDSDEHLIRFQICFYCCNQKRIQDCPTSMCSGTLLIESSYYPGVQQTDKKLQNQCSNKMAHLVHHRLHCLVALAFLMEMEIDKKILTRAIVHV